jgi:uncharacterized membrane protein
MNPYEMVILIVAIVMIARLASQRMRSRDTMSDDRVDRHDKTEIAALKDRIAVLERLVTEDDKAKLLDREIEKLR